MIHPHIETFCPMIMDDSEYKYIEDKILHILYL